MRTIAPTALMVFAAGSAAAAAHGPVTPQELAAAINKADAQLVPYRKAKISPADVRAVRCIASDEEPTEFRCTWEQHVKGGWARRTTWLAVEGTGWRVMDA